MCEAAIEYDEHLTLHTYTQGEASQKHNVFSAQTPEIKFVHKQSYPATQISENGSP